MCITDCSDITLAVKVAFNPTTTTMAKNLKEFADNNFEFDEIGKKFSKRAEKLWDKEKLLIQSNFSFSHGVFKRLVPQLSKNNGLFGKGLKA